MSDSKESDELELTDANFTQAANTDGILLVDFWAPWCGPCRVMSPILEAMATKYKDNPKVTIGKLNVDESQETSMAQHVMTIPTFRFFHKGEPVGEVIGADQSGRQLENKLQEVLAKYVA